MASFINKKKGEQNPESYRQFFLMEKASPSLRIHEKYIDYVCNRPVLRKIQFTISGFSSVKIKLAIVNLLRILSVGSGFLTMDWK